MANIKCKSCEHCSFCKLNGSPNRYYCDAASTNCTPNRLICRTERRSEKFTIKRAPKWCPLVIT